MDNTKRNKMIIMLGVIAFIVVVISSIIFAILDSKKNATLKTVIAPSFATITINGKKYQPNREYRFEPGEYSLKITANNFQETETTVSLNSNETTNLYLYLTPNDGDLSWYMNDKKELTLFSTITDYQATQTAANYHKKYPVSTILPIIVVEVDPVTYNWTEYRIDSGMFDGCNSDFCIKITDTTGGNKENALNKIREKGFNPNDYQIIYEETPIQPLPQN